jgi:hypothetical protein
MNKSPLLTATTNVLMALTALALTAFVSLGLGWRPFLSIALQVRCCLQRWLMPSLRDSMVMKIGS